MPVRLHKIHRDRHLMEVRRDDGSTLRRELETRSTLRHDLMHWALERAVGLRDSFWGRLERGEDPDQDRSAMAAPAPGRAPAEMHATEMLVGMMQGAAARDVDPVAFVALAGEMLALQGHSAPAFLTSELVRAVLARYGSSPGNGLHCGTAACSSSRARSRRDRSAAGAAPARTCSAWPPVIVAPPARSGSEPVASGPGRINAPWSCSRRPRSASMRAARQDHQAKSRVIAPRGESTHKEGRSCLDVKDAIATATRAMWNVEDIKAIPVELDFSSSGQGHRSATAIEAGGVRPAVDQLA